MTFSPLPPAATYGTDANGLIVGWRFAPDQAPAELDSTAARAWLARPAGGNGAFLWLHFNLAHASAERWLRDHAGLDAGFFEALHEGSRSTRIERVADTLFAVLNDVTYNFDFEASDIATLWVSARSTLVVTARRSPLRSVDRLRAAVKAGEGIGSAAALLDHLLRDQADELQRIVRSASERVDAIEDAVLVGRQGEARHALAQLRRMAVRLQRLLAPEPGAFFRMLGSPPRWVGDADVQALRQANEEFSVVLRDIGTLQDRIKLLQDESAARVAEDNNRSLFVLTMVTVLALPINLAAGLLGMNVGGIPFGQHPLGFWIVLGLIATLTASLAWVAVRRLAPRR